MTRKEIAVSTQARETTARIVSSPEEWKAFLRSAARMYKYTFAEQTLIYAQRPDATACASLEQWNRSTFRRWIKPGTKGIALIEDSGTTMRLKYVFDVSDTRQTQFSQPFSMWEYQPEHEAEVLERLENHFGEAEGSSFAEKLNGIIQNITEDNIGDYAEALTGIAGGSQLMDTDPAAYPALLQMAVAPSVTYMALSRMGLPTDHLGQEEWLPISLFNTVETASQLGAAVSDISEMTIRQIESAVKSIKKERGTFAKTENVSENELEEEIRRSVRYGTDIPTGRQLSDPEPLSGSSAGSAGQVWDATQAVSEGAPEGNIRRDASERDAAIASAGDRQDSTGTGGADDRRDGEGRGRDGGVESQRPDGLGGPDEQHPPAGRGSGHAGADLQLNENIENERPEAASPGLSFSLLPGVEEQIVNILDAEQPPMQALSQAEIDHILRRGSSFQDGKFRIYEHYQQPHSPKDRATFLKKEYGIGGGSHTFLNGHCGDTWHDSKGLSISWKSGFSLTNPDLRLPWIKVAKRIGELIAAGQYLTEKEMAHLPQYREEQAQRAIELEQAREAREAMAQAREQMETRRRTGEYRFSLGDTVYLNGLEHTILSLTGELVELSDPKFPLLTLTHPRDEFLEMVRRDARNDHLLAPEAEQTQSEIGGIPVTVAQEGDTVTIDGPTPGPHNYIEMDVEIPEDAPAEQEQPQLTVGDIFRQYEPEIIRLCFRDDGYMEARDREQEEETVRKACYSAIDRAVEQINAPEFTKLYREQSSFHNRLRERVFSATYLNLRREIQRLQRRRPSKTTAERNYDTLMALAPELLKGETFYMRFTAGDAFMPLSMDYLGENRISIAHNYIQNGDLMADPDMEFVFDPEKKTLSARTFQQDGLGLYQTTENGKGEMANPALEKQLNSFTRQWFSNIKKQGYRRQRMIIRYQDVDFEAVYGPEGKIISFSGWDQDGGQPHDEWIAAVRGYAKEHGVQYSLGYGRLGNGITVWNILEEIDHDYPTIAHIEPDGTVKAYEPLPDYIMAAIERQAEAERKQTRTEMPVSPAPSGLEEIPEEPSEDATTELSKETPAEKEEPAPAPRPYQVGDTVYLDDTAFEITEIGTLNVQLRDPSLRYPIFRAESIESFERLLKLDERNAGFGRRHAGKQKNEAPMPEPVEKTVAFYPGEKNNLPYDIEIRTLEIPSREPPALDFHITDDALGHGSPKIKYGMNMDAIHTLFEIEKENRSATAEEQEILAKYVGWGGIPQAFDPNNGGWANEYAELKATLDPTEYEAARATTLNAHYTSPTVIKAIYEAVGNLGFRRGNILEPSCGVGNFFGLLPEHMRESKLYGVELDPITGRIAKQLYQTADIQIKGFEDTAFPDSFFDLAIGNVPFGNYGVTDKRYDKQKFHIHDYFFAKTLDQIRPGGVIAFITSKGTLDKRDDRVRRYIAERADLLGAIRLPNNAFAANAGTDVTADILFLQKRDRPMVTEPEWLHLSQTEDGILVNHYFLAHPEMLLGRMDWWRNMYGNENETACLPIEGANLAEQLKEAVSHILGQYQERMLEPEDEKTEWIPADPQIPNYSFGISGGKLYYRVDSQMQLASPSATAQARIRGMIGLRECTRKLIEYQMENHPDEIIRREQQRLNALYDQFTAKYGRITSRGNKSAFGDDASYPLLGSLEVLDEDGKFERKADMFHKRTIRAQTPVTHVDTAEEALALSIGERAGVDMAYMSELTGMEEAALIEQLRGCIFRDFGDLDPSEIGWAFFDLKGVPFVTADEYLSGNVRAKLKQARGLFEVMERHAEHVEPELIQTLKEQAEALEKVQPKDLGAGEIEVRLGTTWIPPKVVEQFMYELLGTPSYRRHKINVLFSDYTAIWSVTGKSVDYDNNKANLKYGTHRVNAYKIIEECLNLRDVRVFDTVRRDGKEVRELNHKETIVAQQKQQAIRDEFQTWIWKDPERRERLVQLYNEKFNSIRPREYDGSHIQFHGMNPEIELRPHQKNAVARILYGGNTLLGHVVGSGKTYTMAAAAMESKRLGLCHKPMFVVPNHLTDQWASEFLQLYPAANILVTTRRDFEKHNRQRFCSRIATGEYDAVIIGHSQFEKLPMSLERQRAHFEEQIEEVMQGIYEAKEKNAERFTIKQMERTKKQLQAKLDRLNDTERKDRVVTFEELGVDRLFVDEAHSFKNLAAFSKMRNVAGISQTEAQKSSDMFMKCRYLDGLTGNRGVIFATGTPISNTMVEMFTMQRYLQYDALAQRGLAHFDAWASTFGETITAMELAPEGTGFRLRTRFARFFNLPELTTMFREVADIQTSDMLKLPTPEAEYHTEVLEPSQFQRDMLMELAERAEMVRKGQVQPSEDNMLRITGDGRKLALDQRMLNGLLSDDPMSKSNACVENVLRIWKETEADKLTQLVFCDLSTPKGDGFNVYQDVKEKLMKGGVPEHEIAFIHDADSEAQKAALFSKVRAGQVRVLLGSTAKMGAGTNVQRLLIAEHHMDCPWRPADIEQREGRIIRQGNQNEKVHVYRYVTKDTFDAYMWATLEAKQRFISQVMTSRSPARSCEDIDDQTLSYAEVKSLATGDPRIKERMDLEVEISKLKLLRSSHMNQQFEMQSRLQRIPLEIKSFEQTKANFEADHALYMRHKTGDFPGMTVCGQHFAERTDAGAALISACKAKTDPAPTEIGEYMGFKMLLAYELQHFTVILKGAASHSITLGESALGNFQRMNYQLEDLGRRALVAAAEIGKLKQDQKTLSIDAQQPFPQEQELNEKSKRLIALDGELKLKTHEDRVQDTEPEQEDRPVRAKEEIER